MFKKSLLALAVLGSSSAFAATEIQDASEINFATELFGSSDLVLGNTVQLEITDAVSDGATASFTYTLSNGTFGANPTLAFADGAVVGGDAGVSLTAGGQGSSSATFTVVVTEEFTGDETFTLTIPSLADVTALSAAEGSVTVTATVDNTNIVATGFTETVTVPATAGAGVTVATSGVIATSEAGISLEATGSTPLINVAEQTEFDGGGDNVVLFSGVDLAAVAGVVKEDGTTAFDIVTADEATISLTGSFAADAEVCIVPTTETDCTNAVGTSTVTTANVSIALDGADVTTIGGGVYDIIYVVDGESQIPVSDISISATVTYEDADYAGTVTYSNAEEAALGLAGLTALDEDTRINIITRPGGVDTTFVRVTNTGASSAEVYMNLTTQDGTASAFGRLGTLAAGATAVYDSQAIADAVGLETWAGRANGRLSVTTAVADDIVIVPLVRTNDVLTNQASSLKNP